jgi:hypothetical protein
MAAGHPCVVWNRSPDVALRHAKEFGSEPAASLADVAAIKGQALVKAGEEQGGILGGVKAFFGGLIQVLGGVARLAKPLLGIGLMAAGGPAGWIAGLILLGLFAFKEVNCIINRYSKSNTKN